MSCRLGAFYDQSADWPIKRKAQAALSIAQSVLKVWKSDGERLDLPREAVHAMGEFVRSSASGQRADLYSLIGKMERFVSKVTAKPKPEKQKRSALDLLLGLAKQFVGLGKNETADLSEVEAVGESPLCKAAAGSILDAMYVVVNGDSSRWLHCLVLAQKALTSTSEVTNLDVDETATEQIIAWASIVAE